MKRILLLIIASTLVLQVACAKGSTQDYVTKTSALPPFNGIEISISSDVTLVAGNTPSVTIDTKEKLHKKIKIKVKNEKLTIKIKDQKRVFIFFSRKKPRAIITITYNTLDFIALSGTGSLTASDPIQSPDLYLDVVGSGTIALPIETDVVKSSISGSGEITLSGSTQILELSITGSGTLIGSDLASKKSYVDISGSGDAFVYAEEELVANITGSGAVIYKGDPSSVITDITGSGNVIKSE